MDLLGLSNVRGHLATRQSGRFGLEGMEGVFGGVDRVGVSGGDGCVGCFFLVNGLTDDRGGEKKKQ